MLSVRPSSASVESVESVQKRRPCNGRVVNVVEHGSHPVGGSLPQKKKALAAGRATLDYIQSPPCASGRTECPG